MISACKEAKVKLMIAYRQQYEPHNRALRQLVTEGKFGATSRFCIFKLSTARRSHSMATKEIIGWWGLLPDVGLYCLNASRFLSGEEPVEVMASILSTQG